jgi:hypothetical protein
LRNIRSILVFTIALTASPSPLFASEVSLDSLCKAFPFVCEDADFKTHGVEPFVSSFNFFAKLNGFDADYFWKSLSKEGVAYLFLNIKSILQKSSFPDEVAGDYGKWTANFIAESLPLETSQRTIQLRSSTMSMVVTDFSKEDLETIGRIIDIHGLWSELSKGEVGDLPHSLKILKKFESRISASNFGHFLRSLDSNDFKRMTQNLKEMKEDTALEDMGHEYVEYLTKLNQCRNSMSPE